MQILFQSQVIYIVNTENQVSYLCPTFLLHMFVYGKQLSCKIICLDSAVMLKGTNHQTLYICDEALHFLN